MLNFLFSVRQLHAESNGLRYEFFFLCLFARSLFLRLCVFIFRFFRFFPQGIEPP